MFLDQETVAKFAEIDMIAADLEQSKSRVAAVERRNVRLYLVSNVRSSPLRFCRRYCAPKSRHCVAVVIRPIGEPLILNPDFL